MSFSSIKHNRSSIATSHPITVAQIRRLDTREKFRKFMETCSICPPPAPPGDRHLNALLTRLASPVLSCELLERAAVYNLIAK